MEGYCRSEKKGNAGGDIFIVEELLDFSNEEKEEMDTAAEDDGRSVETGANCSSDTRFSDEIVHRSLADGGLSGDLCEPYSELAELEWLSNFVEDSFSSEEHHKQHLISGIKSPSSQPTHTSNHPFVTALEPPTLSADPTVPGKARSKRPRTALSNWSSRLLLLSETTTNNSPSMAGRKCLHCATDKTPQWRAGPMGPKTLCNACGVRFKSGRLVPEYRPAASPTFVLSKHSNSHRKVLELRRQKEVQEKQQFLTVFNRGSPAGFLMSGFQD